MNRESHIRMRGGACRGRGVRTRGNPPRGCGAGRSIVIDKIQIVNIEDLPRAVPFETPLHPRKRRAWDSESVVVELIEEGELEVLEPAPTLECPLPQELSPEAPSPVFFTECVDGSTVTIPSWSPIPIAQPDQGPSLQPQSPLFVECEAGSSMGTTSSKSPIAQYSKGPTPEYPTAGGDHDIGDYMYGSESDDSDEDEDNIVTPLPLPRVYRSVLDTPLEPEPEQPAAPASSLAEGFHVSYDAMSSQNNCQMQPVDLFHFVWSQYPDSAIPSCERREQFTQERVGPTEPCYDPYKIFTQIWDDSIMNHIVKETNRYAQQLKSHSIAINHCGPGSRLSYWQDTCVDEMYVFFAIILATGLVIKSKLEEYWSNNENIFATPGFRAHMTLRRFQLLCTCIHFNNNEALSAQELTPSEAKIFKIQPIITLLNQKFQAMYVMDQNIVLDKSLQRKGYLGINQFISNKVAKIVIKSHEVYESQTGYLWRFVVHSHGRVMPQPQQSPLEAAPSSIVINLLQGLEGKGYTVWMDNFYNSPALARHLKSVGFDVAGTLHTNRQFVPWQLTDLSKESMWHDQIAGLTSGDVNLLVWRDENRVATISTYHGNETSVKDGQVKPCVVLDYNNMMWGVDKKDQLLALFPIERVKTKVWYKKFFRRLLNISVLNAYIISKKSGSSVSHRKFRIDLVLSLLSRHSKPRPIKPFNNDINLELNPIFEAKTHLTLEYPFSSGRRIRRICTICKNRSHFYCAGCMKTVCLGPCFASLHS